LHNEEGRLKDERTNLTQAESSARAVLQDSRAVPLEARAQIALGNALEDFGLLLKDNRDRDAITCFATAARLWQGKPQSSLALVSLGRVMIRSNDESKWPQAEAKLKDALALAKEGDVAAEAHFWLAYLYEKRKDFDAAEDGYHQAELQATTLYFKDSARCEAFDLLLKRALNKPYETTVIQRISLVNSSLPKPELIDPQVRKKAEWLRVKGLNELGNLYFLAARLVPEADRSRYLTKVNEKAELLLRDKPTEIAELYAARLHAKVFLAKNEIRKAFEATEVAGKIDVLIAQWQVNKKVTDPLLEAAILDIANTRFEAFFGDQREIEFLKRRAEESIKWADRLAALLDDNSEYYFLVKGYAGLIRSWVLGNISSGNITGEELRTLFKSNEVTLLQDARSNLRAVLDKMPENKFSWRWAYALYILANRDNDKTNAEKYLAQSLQLAQQQLAKDQPGCDVDKKIISGLELKLKNLK
jgi:hypothetical protein